MLNKIKFSVVCSVYNSEKYIEECILSVLNNTFSDWEFIILDDGSTDSTLSICKKYSEKHKRIRVYSNKNIGPYNERIIGFTLAKGDYVFNIDADDTFEPNAFEQLNCLIEKHEPDIIIFNVYLIFAFSPSNITSTFASGYFCKKFLPKDLILEELER